MTGETGYPPGAVPVSTSEPPETPHPHIAVCSDCRARLTSDSRVWRGVDLCGPCHRKATGTQTLAGRCRAAGLELPLVQEFVLEILASPKGRAAIRVVLNTPPFDAIPEDALRPGDTWRDPEGTEYVVVPAGDVGDRPRWLVGERTTPHHLSGLRTRGDLHRKPPVYHPYVLVEKRPLVDDAASTVPPGSVGIAFAAYLRSAEAREVLGLTPDPRIGRLARLNTERRTVARCVSIEAGGALRLREDGWDPVMQDYRARPDDVEWVNEVVA